MLHQHLLKLQQTGIGKLTTKPAQHCVQPAAQTCMCKPATQTGIGKHSMQPMAQTCMCKPATQTGIGKHIMQSAAPSCSQRSTPTWTRSRHIASPQCLPLLAPSASSPLLGSWSPLLDIQPPPGHHTNICRSVFNLTGRFRRCIVAQGIMTTRAATMHCLGTSPDVEIARS